MKEEEMIKKFIEKYYKDKELPDPMEVYKEIKERHEAKKHNTGSEGSDAT